MTKNVPVLDSRLQKLVLDGKITLSAAKFLQYHLIDRRITGQEFDQLLSKLKPVELRTAINRLRAKRMKIGTVTAKARQRNTREIRSRYRPR